MSCGLNANSDILPADTFHKPGLKMQARILAHLINVVKSNIVRAPLWDVANQGANPPPDNTTYVQQQMTQLLVSSFPNMQAAQIEVTFTSLVFTFAVQKVLMP